MHTIPSSPNIHLSPLQGLQCFINLVLIPRGDVSRAFPFPKKETVGIPKAAEICPKPLSVAIELSQIAINEIDCLKENKNFISPSTFGYIMAHESSYGIDTLEDFLSAEEQLLN